VPPPSSETVVMDATVVIHLANATALAHAVEAGHLRRESSTDPPEIAVYAELRQRMGRGEAACLAMAECRRWMVASDDRGKAFRRLVRERIGQERLIDTIFIANIACEQGGLSADEARRVATLAQGRQPDGK